MTDGREIEAKFEADDQTLANLVTGGQAGAFSLHSTGSKVQDDTYFDTPEARLKDAGCSLRIRRKPDTAEMTFKGERASTGGDSHAVSRLEDEVVLPRDAILGLDDTLPLSLAEEPSPLRRARVLAGEEPLLATARIITNRTIVNAVSGSNVIVELSVDRCQAERIFDGRQVHFDEVEAELKSGTAEDLLNLINELRKAFPGLVPSSRTKLDRALG